LGVPIVRGAIHVRNLFFTDDNLLFYKPDVMEWGYIQHLLTTYEKASGQTINLGKTPIFFSRNTKIKFKEYILSIARMASLNNFEKYLGLRAVVGKSKNKTFASIKGRVRVKLSGWKEKFLSQAGREIIIKA
jgi:hypothetical protein